MAFDSLLNQSNLLFCLLYSIQFSILVPRSVSYCIYDFHSINKQHALNSGTKLVFFNVNMFIFLSIYILNGTLAIRENIYIGNVNCH